MSNARIATAINNIQLLQISNEVVIAALNAQFEGMRLAQATSLIDQAMNDHSTNTPLPWYEKSDSASNYDNAPDFTNR